MPITVKLGRSRLSSNQSGQVEEAGSPDTGLAEARRTVSFNEPSPLQSSLPAFESNEQGQQFGLASAIVPAKRVRSPSPPLDGISSCLPIPAAKRHKIQSPSSQDIDLCLESVVRRYAALAGYDGIQSSVLQLLSHWLQEYLDEIVAVAAEGATSSGRAAPNVRDLLKAIWWHGQLVPVDVDEDDDRGSRVHMDADGLIAWRHRIPDYQEQYPLEREAEPAPLPGWVKSEQATVPLQRRDDVGDDEVFTMELFSNKTRLKEKSQRDEIPGHLPPLPALYTWRRTDSLPTNRLLGNPTSSTSTTQTLTQHPTASSTLARLESRLVSSRLVQTSLSSLIGRLDNAAMPVTVPEASMAPEDATTQGPTGSASLSNSTEPVVSSPLALPGRESPAVGSPSRKESTSMASPLVAGAQSVDAVSTPVRTGGRLSVKLRPQSISGSTVAEALKLSSQPSAMLPPPVPASTSPEEDASSALVARRGIAGHPTLSLSTSQPSASLRRNPLNSLAGFSFPATPGQKTPSIAGMTATRPWDHPLMSPATPMTAGGLGGLTVMQSPSVMTPLGHAGGLLSRRDSIGGGFFSGTSGGYVTPDLGSPRVAKNGLEGTSVVIPQVVNYKSVWYGKKS